MNHRYYFDLKTNLLYVREVLSINYENWTRPLGHTVTLEATESDRNRPTNTFQTHKKLFDVDPKYAFHII